MIVTEYLKELEGALAAYDPDPGLESFSTKTALDAATRLHTLLAGLPGEDTDGVANEWEAGSQQGRNNLRSEILKLLNLEDV